MLNVDNDLDELLRPLDFVKVRILTIDRKIYEVKDPDIIKEIHETCKFQRKKLQFLRVSDSLFIPEHQIKEITFE